MCWNTARATIGITRASGERGLILNQTVLNLLPEYDGTGMPSVSPTAVQVAIVAVILSHAAGCHLPPAHTVRPLVEWGILNGHR